MGKFIVSAAAIAALSLSSLTYADPPPWAGGGKGKGKGHSEQAGGESRSERGGRHFRDEQRIVVHEYYGEAFSHGKKCPPGLAKKNNGCMPPGQAKKWQMGRPLPHDLVYYPVPQPLIVRLGPPPAGHKYVRVAADILLITIGTAIVVDAIQDLGRIG